MYLLDKFPESRIISSKGICIYNFVIAKLHSIWMLPIYIPTS